MNDGTSCIYKYLSDFYHELKLQELIYKLFIIMRLKLIVFEFVTGINNIFPINSDDRNQFTVTGPKSKYRTCYYYVLLKHVPHL